MIKKIIIIIGIIIIASFSVIELLNIFDGSLQPTPENPSECYFKHENGTMLPWIINPEPNLTTCTDDEIYYRGICMTPETKEKSLMIGGDEDG